MRGKRREGEDVVMIGEPGAVEGGEEEDVWRGKGKKEEEEGEL